MSLGDKANLLCLPLYHYTPVAILLNESLNYTIDSSNSKIPSKLLVDVKAGSQYCRTAVWHGFHVSVAHHTARIELLIMHS